MEDKKIHMENIGYRPNDEFNINGKGIGLTVLDFWKYAYSDLNADPRDVIAEFLVSNALDIKESINRQDWTLYDIDYKGVRVEVKCTGYFQTWREDGKVSQRRNFSIRKAKDRHTRKYERHNDIYVFCLLNGETRKEANPLIIDNWDFYVVPTSKINELCGDNNSISLSRVKKISDGRVKYEGLKDKIQIYAGFVCMREALKKLNDLQIEFICKECHMSKESLMTMNEEIGRAHV